MMPSDQDFHRLGDGLGLFGEEGNRGKEIEFCDLPPGSRKLQVARLTVAIDRTGAVEHKKGYPTIEQARE